MTKKRARKFRALFFCALSCALSEFTPFLNVFPQAKFSCRFRFSVAAHDLPSNAVLSKKLKAESLFCQKCAQIIPYLTFEELKPSNKKLRARMIRIVCEIVRCTESEAEALLNAEGWSIRRVADRFDRK